MLWLIKFFSFIDSGERGREGEREGKKHRCERETAIGYLLHSLQLGTKPATQAWALMRNRTCDLLVCGMTPNTLSHTSQGYSWFLKQNKTRIQSNFTHYISCIYLVYFNLDNPLLSPPMPFIYLFIYFRRLGQLSYRMSQILDSSDCLWFTWLVVLLHWVAFKFTLWPNAHKLPSTYFEHLPFWGHHIKLSHCKGCFV